MFLWKWAFTASRGNPITDSRYLQTFNREAASLETTQRLVIQSKNPLLLPQSRSPVNMKWKYRNIYMTIYDIWLRFNFKATNLFILWISKFCIKRLFFIIIYMRMQKKQIRGKVYTVELHEPGIEICLFVSSCIFSFHFEAFHVVRTPSMFMSFFIIIMTNNGKWKKISLVSEDAPMSSVISINSHWDIFWSVFLYGKCLISLCFSSTLCAGIPESFSPPNWPTSEDVNIWYSIFEFCPPASGYLALPVTFLHWV